MDELLRVNHTPSMLKNSVKENNIITKKENRTFTALSGIDGYGKSKPEFQASIQTAQVTDGSSLQLRGDILLESDDAANYDQNVFFNGSGYSLPEQVVLDVNGQQVLQLNSDGSYVANFDRVTKEGFDEKKIQDFMSLANFNIKPTTAGDTHNFTLDLSKFGSALNYFLITGQVSKITVKIRFQTNLAELFNGTAPTASKITGYKLNNLQLSADVMTFQPTIYKKMVDRMESSSGLMMATHSYVPARLNLLPGATTHNIQSSLQYRNVVSVFYIPVPTSVTPNAANISDTDIVAEATYDGGVLPIKQRIKFAGLTAVNQNGEDGCTAVTDHLTGVLKAVKKTPDSTHIGSALLDKYSNAEGNKYQVTGASFVRGNDNLVEIKNSGQNGFVTRGIVINSFSTSQAQTNKTLLQIGVVTSVLEIANGQVQLHR